MAAYFIGHPQVVAADAGSMHVRSAWFGTPALSVVHRRIADTVLQAGQHPL
jgi:hypothetical protein